MTFATVKVFPDPVTPSNVLWGVCERIERTNSAMASGWSPVG